MSQPHDSPDLQVFQDDTGEYQVRRLDKPISLNISDSYQAMLKDPSTPVQEREFIKRKMKALQWLIESIEDRCATSLKVAQAIVGHQREFLDDGPDHIHPLDIQEIAEQVGVHDTTVRLAVEDKWIRTPHGIFPLERFFAGEL